MQDFTVLGDPVRQHQLVRVMVMSVQQVRICKQNIEISRHSEPKRKHIVSIEYVYASRWTGIDCP